MKFLILLFLLTAIVCANAVSSSSLRYIQFGDADAALRILVVCGLHPREEISFHFCRRWEQKLKTMLVDHKRLAIDLVTVVHSGVAAQPLQDPCWRGNSRGVDLNRNWPPIPGCHARQVEASTEQPPYAGPVPFSEHETTELAAILIDGHYDMLFAIHSGTRAVLTPYDSCEWTPWNFDEMMQVARWLTRRACPDCTIDASPTVLQYEASGTLTDYAYHFLGIPLVYTFEIYENAELVKKNVKSLNAEVCAALFSPPDLLAIEHALSEWDQMLEDLIRMNPDDYHTLLRMTVKSIM